ncbi:YlzJ-like family protein [Cohnella fermenti]|uniref:YlzJ-like protein n=1 Tax=Cohnella fermenti TaxID=2565925 RepID=A0A4S4BTR1_9BACL|nr:YlzJ-like family protein [Cohnella fermenti]THF78432.1 hypothetical protein E6C55_14590 [Cohnella fermenti]
MILYTCMPLDRVMEGWENGPGPLLEIEQAGMTMLLSPVSPGVGRLVRLVSAPLDAYLNPGYSPGSLIYFANREGRGESGAAQWSENAREMANGRAEVPLWDTNR